MSLIDAWITPDGAIVAVDTDGVGQDGARMPSSKCLPIPHLNTLVAARGQAGFFWFLFMRCLSSSFESFDELNDAIPDLLKTVDEMLPAELIVRSMIGNELLIVGWSARRSRMLGRVFYKRGEMTDFAAADVDHFISPWDKSMPDMPKTPHLVEKIARAQVRWMRETYPNAACGGKLLVCNVTKKSIAIDHRSTFPVEVPA